jgi:hypothetical protein
MQQRAMRMAAPGLAGRARQLRALFYQAALAMALVHVHAMMGLCWV